MSALWYIIRKTFKNHLKEIIRKPVMLIFYSLITLVLVFNIIASTSLGQDIKSFLQLYWLTGGIFAYITVFIFLFVVVTGTSKGSSIFGMSDVNLLFVSPISPRKILFYGVLRMMRDSFLAVVFVLFMAVPFKRFGVGYGGVLLTFFGLALSIVVLSVVSLIVYSATNGNKKRKLVVKLLFFAMFLPAAVYYALRFFETEDIILSLGDLILSPFILSVPVAGWTAAGVSAFLFGDIVSGLMFLGLNILLGGGLILYVIRSNHDYYEDTLVSAETTYEKLRAVSEGNINSLGVREGKVKITKTGVSGFGASALFYKHIRESFRENRLGFLTVYSLIIAGGAIAVSYFSKDLITVLSTLVWFQVFKVGMGRGQRELFTHYVYMIPESSFRKILWSNMEIMLKALVESVLIFGVSGIIIGAGIGVMLGCIAVLTLFSLVLLGMSFFSMRFTGMNIGKGILLMFYFMALIVFMAPGVVPAFIIGFYIGGVTGLCIGLFIIAAWELIAGLILLALSKGVLHRCDMPTMKPLK
ncbi:MAG: putative ABC exporter domain-containing protein [Oscillospiraceae bacterium]|jgi:hypothetical protein|nr:putative ABC exporter domain-containing protein [Oscillospiraceae bacterium]